jgi:hypothetical protein
VNYFPRENDTYFWTPEIPVQEDAEEFERICDKARKADSGQEKLRLSLEACQAYHGDFFGVQMNTGWAVQEARRYDQLFIECTERAADLLRESRSYTELEKLGRHASRVQMFFDWERLTLEALIEQGRYAEAKKQYLVTEQHYRTEMDLPVGRRIMEQFQRLPLADGTAASEPGLLWQQMTEECATVGGYLCSNPVFEGICRMEKRRMASGANGSLLMSAGLYVPPDQNSGTETEPDDADKLRQALVQAVRPSDALTELSRGRFLILLAEAGEEEGQAIFQKAFRLYRESGGLTALTYKLLALESA